MTSVLLVVYIAVIALALTNAKPDSQVSKDKLKEAAMVIANDCKEKEGASDDDIKALIAHKIPETEKGLCMVQCLLNSGKIIQNGKFSKEGAIDFCTPAMKGDAVKIKKMQDMMAVCEKEIGAETGCKVAKLFSDCTMKHGKEFGFEFPNHLKQ